MDDGSADGSVAIAERYARKVAAGAGNYQRANSTAHTKDLQVAFDIVTAYQRMIDYLREEQIEIQMIPWLQRFQGYRASLVAEQAIGQKDKDMLQKCQQVMRELGPVYKRTNEQYPERLQRYERLMDYQL